MLKQKQVMAYFAGGSVRAIFRVTPKDYDIATSALPDQIEELFTKTISVGKSFGVISVIKDEIQTDIATFELNLVIAIIDIMMLLNFAMRKKMQLDAILPSMLFFMIQLQKKLLIMWMD